MAVRPGAERSAMSFYNLDTAFARGRQPTLSPERPGDGDLDEVAALALSRRKRLGRPALLARLSIPLYYDAMTKRFIIVIQALVVVAGLCAFTCLAQQAKSGDESRHATVPLYSTGNRAHVDLDFVRPDGSTRRARFIVDTGGGAFILGEALAKDIGLSPNGPEINEDGTRFAPAPAPRACVGGLQLELQEGRVFIVPGTRSPMPGDDSEGTIPGHVLARNGTVVFDYPAGRFTIVKAGGMEHDGRPLPSPVFQRSGFPRIELELGGHSYGFLLDTGATYTMMSRELMDRWRAEHQDWKTASGAAGLANMIGNKMETSALLMRIPEMKWGPFSIKDAGVVSRPAGTFERYMSGMMSAPIVGSIGGNVLRAFRIEIDYANGRVYLNQTGSMEAGDLDVVPITISPVPGAGFLITGVSSQFEGDAAASLRPGDKLVEIDNVTFKEATIFRALDGLKGKPGDMKVLTIERDGKTIKVAAKVIHLL